MKSDVSMPVTNWLHLIEILQRWLITSTITLRAKSDSKRKMRPKLPKKDWKELHKLFEQIQSETIPLEEKSACRFGKRLIILGQLIKQLISRSIKVAKKKKSGKMKAIEAVAEVAAAAAESASAAANEIANKKKKKKKKYQRSVKVRAAGEVAKFLVYNAKTFRGRYEGDTLYSFRVDMDDKSFLDDLLDRLGQ